jgi:ABC-type amino acid transport/signal transduction systems, periplasmic component/domain
MRILLLILPLLWSLALSAQSDSVLRVGLKETLPFVDIQKGQRPTGMSMLFWEMLNGKLAAKSEYHVFDSVEDMLTALERGEIDLSINPITVSEERLERLEFSQPFFISGTAMARPEENRWLLFLENLFSWRFFSAIGLLALVILLFGFLVWLFERKKNPAQFQKGWRGIFDGFWWSAVTMTTVGYGDKSPVSRGGRAVAVVWMFAAILLISGLTAGVASALTVSRLESNITEAEDLQGLRTGTVGGSSTVAY